jgi:regulator of protease activity HflC (stomatin/prohibitin superfamily)
METIKWGRGLTWHDPRSGPESLQVQILPPSPFLENYLYIKYYHTVMIDDSVLDIVKRQVPYLFLTVGAICLCAMFFIGIVAMLIGLACLIVSTAIGIVNRDNKIGFIILILSVAMLVIMVIIASASLVTVDTGEVAIITVSPNSDLRGATLGTGWHFDPIYCFSNIEKIRYNTQTIEYVGEDYIDDDVSGSLEILSNESLMLCVDMSITYNIPLDNVSDIRTTYGADFENTIFQCVRSIPRQICSQYSALDIVGGSRATIEQEITDKLTKEIESYGIEVVTVNLRDIRLPDSLSDAIEEKKVAEQEILTAQYNAQTIEIQALANMTKILIEANATAQASIIEADGQAEAIQTVMAMLQGSNETESMQYYLTWLYMQALMDPNSNVEYIITDDGNLLLTLGA